MASLSSLCSFKHSAGRLPGSGQRSPVCGLQRGSGVHREEPEQGGVPGHGRPVWHRHQRRPDVRAPSCGLHGGFFKLSNQRAVLQGASGEERDSGYPVELASGSVLLLTTRRRPAPQNVTNSLRLSPPSQGSCSPPTPCACTACTAACPSW